MLESGLSGSVRGVSNNGHPYRDPRPKAEVRPNGHLHGSPGVGTGVCCEGCGKAKWQRFTFSFRICSERYSRAHLA
jgi:hypothetical protein